MGVATQIREPLQHLLVELGACDDALEWCKGRTMDEATWKQASPEWRTWLAEKLECAKSFAAVSKAVSARSGSGSGSGDGYGYGSGDGYGYGYGYGYGSGSGDGYGSQDVVAA